jgi:hypothetical protein
MLQGRNGVERELGLLGYFIQHVPTVAHVDSS